jgi:hypothetical protein
VVVRKHSELFRTYGSTAGEYEIHKELIGSKCQKNIVVHFDLKANLSEIGHEIQGGRLLTKKEFDEKIQSEQGGLEKNGKKIIQQ